MSRHFLFISTLIFLFSLKSNISSGQYYFNKLTEENGLSDNRVSCFLKDKTGFLWIGTKNGLNRYDGKSFKIFKPNSDNSISNEVINDIVQDSSGIIWVATLNGLNKYDPVTNIWETMLPESSDIKGDIPSYLIWDLYVDENSRIWIVSDVWELSVYDPFSKKFRDYDWPSFNQQKQFEKFPRYRSIQKIERKDKNECWLATTIGLFSVNIQSGEFIFYGAGYSGSVSDLKYDKQTGNVFTVTENGELFCYNEISKTYKQLKTFHEDYPAVRWNKIKNNPLLLSHKEGMIQLDPFTNEAEIILNRPALSSSLLPGSTNCIYVDKDGITWIGTNNGINYFNSHNQVADFIPLTIPSPLESLDGMSAAYYDSIDRKYFITSLHSKEVFIIDESTGKISSVRSVSGKSLSACTNICSDRQNNIWLLTETNVYQYDRAKKQFNLFPTPNNNVPVIFHEMLQDKKGDYWLATWLDGLYRYKTKEKSFYKFTEKDGFYSKSFTALINDPIDDAVWLGTFQYGLNRFDLEKNNFIGYGETKANPDYQQLNLIRDAATDADGKIWVSTYGAGLYVYRHGNSYEKSFSHITAKNGLTNSNYFSIAADNKKRLWLLSGKGLSAINDEGKYLYDAISHPAIHFSNYATDTRYPKRIFFNSIKNELLVPVAGGLLLYYPDKEIVSVGFPITLTGISIDGKQVIYDTAYITNSNIQVPYKSNSISFQFAALNFENNEATRYEYKLHANDAEWKTTGNSDAVNFPNLAPGYYTFIVRAKSAAGTYSTNTVSFSFRIIPPFWITWWFIALLVMAMAFGFYRWTVYLRRKIKAQKILNYFATSLYGKNTVDDIFWDVAKNCISQLKFTDCVVYLYDPQKKILVQKAAYGPKNPEKHQINNALDIPIGKGIVGAVAQTGKAEIIKDTSKDSRYIVDDEKRNAEIAVPILLDGKIFGVIDSEHPQKNFYKKYHLKILQDIAVICSDKISKYIIEERLRSKISRDLHDEIGSALSSINVLSKVALNKAGSDTEINNYLSKIKDSTFQTMESMSDIVWAINPKNDKLESLISRMKEFAADICEAKGIDLSFTNAAELEDLSIDLENRKNIFLVFKEAVNNAVKYSGCTLLSFRIEKTAGQLLMEIQDNGKGFDKETVVRGNGLFNMDERAAESNGNLQIKSSVQNGTHIILQIPLTRFGG